MSSLNPKQIRFCEEYLIDLNGSQAAIRAGYSKKTSRAIASELLDNPDVQAKVKELMDKRSEKTEITAAEVLKEIYHSAFVDIGEAYDERGNLLPVHAIPPHLRRSINSIKVFEEFEGFGQERVKTGDVRELKFNPKLKALELLGKHLGLFKEKLEIKADESLEALLAEIGKKPNESSGGR